MSEQPRIEEAPAKIIALVQERTCREKANAREARTERVTRDPEVDFLPSRLLVELASDRAKRFVDPAVGKEGNLSAVCREQSRVKTAGAS